MLRKSALAGAVTGALIVGGLGLAPATAAPVPSDPATTAAAGWLTGQLNAQDLLGPVSAPDLASTFDFASGLARTGASPQTLSRVRSGLDAVVAGYVGTSGDLATSAKVAVAASAYSLIGNPRDAAGTDLIAHLEAVVDDTTGQLQNTWGVDLFNQSSAVLALHAAASPEAGKATDFLLAGRCAGTGWGYDDFVTHECLPQADYTALAITALAPQKSDPQVADEIAEASAWLVGQQRADGALGFVPGEYGLPYNTNSTGMAAWALAQAGHAPAAAKAAAWVRAHQVGLPCDQGLKSQTGAILYSDEALAQDLGPGLADTSEPIKATAQAFPALTLAPAASGRLAVSSPAFAAAGSTIRVSVTGVAPGERACLTGAPKALVGASGPLTLSVPAAGTLTLTTLSHSASARVQVLGATRLTVKTPRKATRGKKVKVTVKGLAAGEKVVVKVVGKKAAQGKANARGVFTKKVKIAKKFRSGKKVKVTVTGQFANRTGKTTLRVR